MNTIPDVNGELVLSKDENGYAEVIEDFQNASSITIITYNISPHKNDLLDKLHQLSDDKDVTVITKIPSRWNYYTTYDAKKKALTQIEQYCSRLDPSKFSCHLSTYFNEENHAKIIMTENIAYIGSQNFSDESRNNFESGIIIRDSDVILQIREQMVEEILDASTPYSSSFYYLHQEGLLYWLQECKRIVQEFEGNLYTVAEVGPGLEDVEVLSNNALLKAEDWEDIIQYHEDVFSIVENIESHESITLNLAAALTLHELKIKLEVIKMELAALASFNPNILEIAGEDYRYYSGEPEEFEIALQAASNAIAEQHSDIMHRMQDKTDEIKDSLQQIPSLLEQLITSLKEYKFYTNSAVINNTGLQSEIIQDRD
ncbi:conserved hypothetical protein [Bacillus mycoides]|uniref:PLD phosphodiesterase domain-containing protein n=1 Tax=Bacillus mycoides TaxID=1405 RepID=A0A654AW50_BACMY|nr:phospholipase D-like domain-containing protein [Bacillus mycoides]VXC71048.1 conserved hypothetical protein [Bacillus mycoides]